MLIRLFFLSLLTRRGGFKVHTGKLISHQEEPSFLMIYKTAMVSRPPRKKVVLLHLLHQVVVAPSKTSSSCKISSFEKKKKREKKGREGTAEKRYASSPPAFFGTFVYFSSVDFLHLPVFVLPPVGRRKSLPGFWMPESGVM